MLLGLLAGCATSSARTTERVAASPARLSEVSYGLSWSWGTAHAERGSGWSTDTDRGTHVVVERGGLVDRTMALVPCARVHDSEEKGMLGMLDLFGLLHAARACDDEDDASTVDRAVIEPLDGPSEQVLGRASFAPETYCKVFYRVGRATGGSHGPKNPGDMLGHTLTLSGTWSVADSAPTPFHLEADMAWGAMAPLPALHGAGSANLVLERQLGAIFDGVDFAHDTDAQAARQVLRNITGSGTLKVASP